jgi:hypothetical protein
MTKVEQDLAQVLQFMRNHSLKLSHRSKEFLLSQFPALKEEIEITAKVKKQDSQSDNGDQK